MMRRILITLIVCFYILPTFAYTVDITTLGQKEMELLTTQLSYKKR